MNKTLLSSLSLLALGLALQPARAGELYGLVGLPGIGLGFAQPLNDSVGLRADFTTLGNRSKDGSEEGINYTGKLKLQRTALLADWYPMQGSFRITGGATLNQMKVSLHADGSSGSLTIGDTTYPTTADDKFDVEVKFPNTTPYLGIGWGHGKGSGLRVSADLGASFGRAKLTAALSGPNASKVSQADIDAELAQLREGVGKIRVIPQISLAIGYSF